MTDFDDDAAGSIASAALAVLREQGPLSLDEWATHLEEYGTATELADVLEYLPEPMLGYLPNGKYVALDAALEGLVFTHRLSESEIASDVLDASPDLEPILAFGGGEDGAIRVALAEEAILERGAAPFPSRRVVVLPVGTLGECADGDLVGLAVEDGRLAFRLVEIEDEPDLVPALDELFEEDGVEALDSVCWQLLLEDPSLFTVPIAPLGEFFEAAGYEHERELLARRGFDFDAYDLQIRTALVASTYDLTHDEAVSAVAFVDLADRGYTDAVIADFDIADWAHRHVSAAPDSFVSLADPGAAIAVFDLGFRNQDPATDAILEALAAELAERGPRPVRAAAHWLAGKAVDRLGRVLEAEAHYEKALLAESGWGPALFELAQFASDRGDAIRALSLLGRIDGGSEENLYAVLQDFVPTDHPELGRNDKCWCGSGRKYKVCHLGKADESVKVDGRWLYKKACLFAFASEFVDIVTGLDDLENENLSEDELIAATIFDGSALDVALFEGGVFADFLARRGELLPESEVVTAAQWLGTRRSVYEVVESSDTGVVLLDRGTKETVTVAHSVEGQPGDVISARVLTAPTGALVVGVVVMASESQAAKVLEVLASEELDAEEVVRASRGGSDHSTDDR
ncbi:MAG: SEC-C domain-containing protein [Rhodococcus sp. (in: high G+C Gram-positive bacteria)]|uniref:SEC-C domain-containing protein n=1 Tax=Rhodococcus sp. TaxID=1831 RepID=UPI002AD5CBCD|nr:SEC-C domain-containing protein [Rhodococcus sp. (in: high G+C Gram-positive bacteria)]